MDGTDFVTRNELVSFTAEIREDIAELKNSISELSKAIVKLEHILDKNALVLREENDQRYCMRETMIQDTISILDNPEFSKHAEDFVADAIVKEKARKSVESVISCYIAKGRDNATKWWNFFRIVGVALLGYIIYIIISSQMNIIDLLNTIAK
ncbi:MAG TPA: hypothetical protein PLQ59_09550 [Fervidobacterium sp.]|nr:hypothetical protein [Fervidobacterium sp.]